ncbi:hypothetical protein ACFL5A_04610 [Gemmatimonadota bacterium]
MSTTRYRYLDAGHIVETVRSVKARIDNRFPESGLGRVCHELLETGEAAAELTTSLGRPIYAIRIFSWFLIALIILLALGQLALLGDLSLTFETVGDLVEAIEAMLNELVLLGLAVLFLATAEGRIKRYRSLRALRELRSLAHVVDMHQLTKDPKDLLVGEGEEEGMEAMSREDLAHYLDYCSEILSLTSKLAALYLGGFNDHVVIGAVNEIENLTSGLSGKIWQKIMILDRVAVEP